MRTTIDVDDHLLREMKLLARHSGRTLAAVIEDALRERLARRRTVSAESVRLPTVGGDGLRPGVDLDDSATLRDLMDADT